MVSAQLQFQTCFHAAGQQSAGATCQALGAIYTHGFARRQSEPDQPELNICQPAHLSMARVSRPGPKGV